MNYLLGQGVSKEWLLLQQSAAGTTNILLLLAEVQYDAKWKTFYSYSSPAKNLFLCLLVYFFFHTTKPNQTKL